MWLWISGGVYTNKYVNILEGSFLLNLTILTAITYFVDLFRGNYHIVEYTWTISVSIAFATFIGILASQLTSVTCITQYLKRKCKAIRNQEPKPPTGSLPDRLINAEEYELPFHTPQEHADAELTEEEMVDGAQGRLTPVYTCDSTND